MGAADNKRAAQDAYEAFNKGDAEGAMRDIDDQVEWTVRGDNSLTGVYHGKAEVGEFWSKLVAGGFRSSPHDFIADGDKVVVLTTDTLDGEQEEAADILTYNDQGKLIAFDTLSDQAVTNRIYAK